VPARPLTATRRAALAVTAGLGGLAVAGCTTDDGDPPTSTSTASAPSVDADAALVSEVAGRVAAADALVRQVLRDSPLLRSDLDPLRRMHEAHLEALGGHDGPARSSRPPRGRPADALRQVATSEQRLQRSLATAAVRAESGTLAKLLASMSAAVAQQLAALG
jgi:hypothetical protein